MDDEDQEATHALAATWNREQCYRRVVLYDAPKPVRWPTTEPVAQNLRERLFWPNANVGAARHNILDRYYNDYDLFIQLL